MFTIKNVEKGVDKNKNFGVFATTNIYKNTIIAEYSGDVMTTEEFE